MTTDSNATIHCYRIAIGAAAAEGRAPSHDGEYLTLYYRPGDDPYIIEDNAGLAWTYWGEDDARADYEAADQLAEWERIMEEITLAMTQGLGEPATSMGAAARDVALAWDWGITRYYIGGRWDDPRELTEAEYLQLMAGSETETDGRAVYDVDETIRSVQDLPGMDTWADPVLEAYRIEDTWYSVPAAYASMTIRWRDEN